MTMMTTTTLEGWDARISQVPSLVKGPLFCPVFARIPGPLVLPGSVVFGQELTLWDRSHDGLGFPGQPIERARC